MLVRSFYGAHGTLPISRYKVESETCERHATCEHWIFNPNRAHRQVISLWNISFMRLDRACNAVALDTREYFLHS